MPSQYNKVMRVQVTETKIEELPHPCSSLLPSANHLLYSAGCSAVTGVLTSHTLLRGNSCVQVQPQCHVGVQVTNVRAQDNHYEGSGNQLLDSSYLHFVLLFARTRSSLSGWATIVRLFPESLRLVFSHIIKISSAASGTPFHERT